MSYTDREIKKYIILNRENYDKQVKISSSKIGLYSKKRLDSIYRNGEYNIIGEAKPKSKKRIIGELLGIAGNKTFVVTKTRTHNRLFYREAGYVQVEDENADFIAVLKRRLAPFLIALLVILLAVIAFFVYLQFAPSAEETITIPPDDQYAQELTPEQDQNINKDDDDDSKKNKVGLVYTKKATLYLSERYIKTYFLNPSDSNQNVVLKVYVNNGDEPVLIGSSDLIRKGNGLAVVDFDENVNLSAGTYSGKYTVIAYADDTDKQSNLEMDIPITITVEN